MKKSLRVSLRKANFRDIEFLWYLRNQADVFKYSITNKKIGWEEHVNWIVPIILGFSNRELFVIESFKNPIGQIRLDYKENKEVEISISILKEFRGKGFAKEALSLVIKKIRKNKRIKLIIATIHKSNIASRNFFEKFSFELKKEKKYYQTYIFKL